jgi:hypothetical protein
MSENLSPSSSDDDDGDAPPGAAAAASDIAWVWTPVRERPRRAGVKLGRWLAAAVKSAAAGRGARRDTEERWWEEEEATVGTAEEMVDDEVEARTARVAVARLPTAANAPRGEAIMAIIMLSMCPIPDAQQQYEAVRCVLEWIEGRERRRKEEKSGRQLKSWPIKNVTLFVWRQVRKKKAVLATETSVFGTSVSKLGWKENPSTGRQRSIIHARSNPAFYGGWVWVRQG